MQASAASGASAVCNSSSATGIVSEEVSSNGRDFTTSGVQFELVRVVLSEVAPWTGPDLGGTLVTLTGSGIGAVSPLSLDCRFGELEPVSASVHGGSEARCVSPATSLVGWTGVELLSDGVALRSGGSFLYYSRVWVSAVVPLLGPVEGGTRLTVLGTPFREAATLRCRFDERSKTAVSYTHLTLPTIYSV